jgi:acetyltransferase-like isoleucine patch superfamily enzyme
MALFSFGFTIGNNKADIQIGKNARIAGSTIIAVGAIVTRVFHDEFVTVDGNPAKIIKSGVNWHIDTSLKYKKKLDNHKGKN